MNLDEYEQMFHKVERRLRDPRVVEVLANTDLRVDNKAEFQEEANLKPVFEALQKLGLKPEMRRDEEHSAWAVVYPRFDQCRALDRAGARVAARIPPLPRAGADRSRATTSRPSWW